MWAAARPGETASPSGASVNQRGSVMLWYLVPIGAVGLFVAVSVMVAASLAGSDSSSAAAERASGKLASYWIVKAGANVARALPSRRLPGRARREVHGEARRRHGGGRRALHRLRRSKRHGPESCLTSSARSISSTLPAGRKGFIKRSPPFPG